VNGKREEAFAWVSGLGAYNGHQYGDVDYLKGKDLGRYQTLIGRLG
jgi:hypothetical protein